MDQFFSSLSLTTQVRITPFLINPCRTALSIKPHALMALMVSSIREAQKP
jgi:hypothetical protein